MVDKFQERFEIIRRLEEKRIPYFHSNYGIFQLEKNRWQIVRIFESIKEEVIAYGHPKIQATHESTLEITKEDFLTEKGDCIIGIKANKSVIDFSEEFKIALKSGAKVKITIIVDELQEVFYAFGSPALKLTNDKSIVIRKSDFIDDRTAVILSNKAAIDIDRRIVEKIKNPNKQLKIIFEIEKES
ncbi:MAG: DUF371 domain-containing protein [Candidatus Aenigmatarchaeota archaeon]